ncbi:uncharacterized protein DUF955 [Litoreibacter ponti]|uniref:Uncharacterized protein DUF955 n=1 Tax=Litoreibacter ponti TaxID=1510457 RepID=A0A2T6BMY3_9RHOB|nr:ImmA/IrrE family metallo-endopeptidase [Litoreibacter ponti]PTX57402.1 uncharacterized protein DUF955 [Litoreibacter ponti]
MVDLSGLKRVDVADIHAPGQLARDLHVRMGTSEGPVPITEIAKALDISHIRIEEFDGFEGMLLTDRHRSDGVILANNRNGMPRARFTVAHELGHFLLERHTFSNKKGFRCIKKDLRTKSAADDHQRQESEANKFAIELLAPKDRFHGFLKTDPDLEHIREAAGELDISKEATARRYLDLSDAMMAMVFHRHGKLRYFDKTKGFPFLPLVRNAAIPATVAEARGPDPVTTLVEADPKDWFDGPPGAALWVQTLFQKKGYGTTMLLLDDDGFGYEDDGNEPEDTFKRYAGFN